MASSCARPLTPPCYPILEDLTASKEMENAEDCESIEIGSWEECNSLVKSFVTSSVNSLRVRFPDEKQNPSMIWMEHFMSNPSPSVGTKVSSNRGIFPGKLISQIIRDEVGQFVPSLKFNVNKPLTQVIHMYKTYPMLHCHPRRDERCCGHFSMEIVETKPLPTPNPQTDTEKSKCDTHIIRFSSFADLNDVNSPLYSTHEEVTLLEKFKENSNLLKHEEEREGDAGGLMEGILKGLNLLVTGYESLHIRPQPIGKLFTTSESTNIIGTFKRRFTFLDFLWELMKDVLSVDGLIKCWNVLYRCHSHKYYHKHAALLSQDINQKFEELSKSLVTDLSRHNIAKDFLIEKTLELGVSKVRDDFLHVVTWDRRSRFCDLIADTFPTSTNVSNLLGQLKVLQLLAEHSSLQMNLLYDHGELFEDLAQNMLLKTNFDSGEFLEMTRDFNFAEDIENKWLYEKLDNLVNKDLPIYSWRVRLGGGVEVVAKRQPQPISHELTFKDVFAHPNIMWKLSVQQTFIDKGNQEMITCVKNVGLE